MKKLYLLPVICLLLGLSSCGYVDYDDWDDWDPEPPYGWNDSFFDPDLDGTWELYLVNSSPVYDDEVNYVQFYGDGRGYYCYYDHGYRESERIAYWCQRAVGGASSRQINIQYEYGRPSTMNYWFTDRYTLWMQWRNSYGVQTYVYKAIPHLPW